MIDEMKPRIQNSELITHSLELETFLLGAQNADGGWGYQPDAASATEPTSWALLALCAGIRTSEFGFRDTNTQPPIPIAALATLPQSAIDNRQSAITHALSAGKRWLHVAQLPDGSWPAFVGQRPGCWVTAAACLALHRCGGAASGGWVAFGLQQRNSSLVRSCEEISALRPDVRKGSPFPYTGPHTEAFGLGRLPESRRLSASRRRGTAQPQWLRTAIFPRLLTGHSSLQDPVALGLRWLCRTWPADGNVWFRFRQRLRKQASVIRQDSSLSGWSWTPGTASWVEPTAHALIALRCIPAELHPPGASKRRRLGERMLYDRMCPGGGWNSGNPLVYGVAGEPRVGPTAWALLALHDYRDRPENRESLDWLERVYPQIRGPASLAVAHLCLEAYERPLPPLEPALSELWANNQFFRNVLVTAWAVMALS